MRGDIWVKGFVGQRESLRKVCDGARLYRLQRVCAEGVWRECVKLERLASNLCKLDVSGKSAKVENLQNIE